MDILQKYKEYATGATDAPSKYHDYCAAAMVGAALGRGLHYQHGHITLFPHIWVCLIGQSTLMKKSTSIRIAETLLARVNERLLLPAKFSVEKLYQVLSENPSGMMTFSEFHSLLSMMSRDYNVELKSTLADFWDSPPVKSYTTVGGGTVTVKSPALTILAGSTTDWISEAAKTRDIQGGFYPRWLFSIATTSDQPDMPLPPPRNEIKANAIVQELVAIAKTYDRNQGEQGRITMTPKGQSEYRRIYSELRNTYGNDPFLPKG